MGYNGESKGKVELQSQQNAMVGLYKLQHRNCGTRFPEDPGKRDVTCRQDQAKHGDN